MGVVLAAHAVMNNVQSSAPHAYSTKIIKAGALLDDAKTLLAHWDTSTAVAENIDRFRRENVFGKASRSRVDDILAALRQRYLGDPDVLHALVALVRGRWPATNLNRVLYFHAARADRLLGDTVTRILCPLHSRGATEVSPVEVQRELKKWHAKGQLSSAWSDDTTLRVAQGLLSALRDFGVLQGASRKRIAPAYLPVEAFAYVAFCLKKLQPSGARLLDDPCWRLFFLQREGVERSLVEANQHGLLEYQAAGAVTRLTFPADTTEEYANVLAQGSH